MARRKTKPKKKARWEKMRAAALPVGNWLLDKLLELVELFPGPLEGPYGYRRRLEGWPKAVPCHRIRHELKRMKDRGWIEEAEKQGKKFFKLTKKGRLRALYRKIEGLAPPSRAQWNGKWVAAIFDIPEKDGRAERDAIRRTLVAAGFFRLQKSVYIYPDEMPDDVLDYLTDANLLQFIRFARIDRIDHEKDIRKHFKFR